MKWHKHSTALAREGARALFEYFEQYEQDTCEQMKFDPVAIRCDFDEYENLKSYSRKLSRH
jgi:hypothetical protein